MGMVGVRPSQARYGERTPERAETDLPQVAPRSKKRSHTIKRIQAELQELNAGEQSIAALEQHEKNVMTD